jgi:hypothetical protein
MEVIGNYQANGYAHVRGLIPPEVARAFMAGLKQDLGPSPISLASSETDIILKRPAFEIYGYNYKPMSYFLWGLTPTISSLVGLDVLPTYDYFRIYREGDLCLVHSDRDSCEHSVSLTLDYSDGEVWDLELGRRRIASAEPIQDDFGNDEFTAIPMQIGDAVIYQGVHYRHGRTRPNPNAWSAHLFLHYVDRRGRFANLAFDQQADVGAVNFTFV